MVRVLGAREEGRAGREERPEVGGDRTTERAVVALVARLWQCAELWEEAALASRAQSGT